LHLRFFAIDFLIVIKTSLRCHWQTRATQWLSAC